MKILDIIPYIPYPLNSGGNQAVFNMLEAMLKEHEVHLLLRVRGSNEHKAVKQLQALLPSLVIHTSGKLETEVADSAQKVVCGEDGLTYTPAMRLFDYIRKSMERKIERRKKKMLRKMQTEREEEYTDILSTMVRHSTTLYNFQPELPPDYLQDVYEITRADKFDVIQCEFYETLSLVALLPPEQKKVFIHHELRYVRNCNELDLISDVQPQDILRYNQLKDSEIGALRHFDVVVTLTETDKHLLENEAPGLNVVVSPAIVKYEETPLPFTPLSRDMVFVGSGDHFPNFDGLLWYAKEIAPILRKRGEEPLLHVTGQWSADKRKLVASLGANIHFDGFVEDLHTFLNGKLSIVPIRIGSGMRMKILDAIDSASPVVSTSKGCEGLGFQHDVDGLVCDTPTDFAQAIHRVMGDISVQTRLAEHSKKLLTNVFGKNTQTETRLKIYREI